MIKDLYPEQQTIFLGYCTDIDAYIPSSRQILEGGYEGDTSIYDSVMREAPFTKDIDGIITKAVAALKV